MTIEAMGHVLLEPEIILPSQLPCATVETPEKRLLLAVLEEAVWTYQRNRMATEPRGRALFTDVEAWFASEDSDWTFSFVAICDVLGLDASYLRRGIRRLRESGEVSRRTGEPRQVCDFRRVITPALLPYARSRVRRGVRR